MQSSPATMHTRLHSSRSEASPIYIIFFLSATYFLNRPCVYCSLLLAMVVLAVFNFQGDWFEPQSYSTSSNTAANQANSTLPRVADGITFLASALNETAATLFEAGKSEVERRARTKVAWYAVGADWLKNIISRGELRIECMNTVIRL